MEKNALSLKVCAQLLTLSLWSAHIVLNWGACILFGQLFHNVHTFVSFLFVVQGHWELYKSSFHLSWLNRVIKLILTKLFGCSNRSIWWQEKPEEATKLFGCDRGCNIGSYDIQHQLSQALCYVQLLWLCPKNMSLFLIQVNWIPLSIVVL